MASYGFIGINSNDGSQSLKSWQSGSNTPTISVTSTGVTDGTTTYTYSGDKTFLGVATSANATEPTYAVGNDYTLSLTSGTYLELYIVEAVADPTITYDLTQLNLSAGTHTISVIGKADGYNASAASTGAAFVVEASTVTLEAGTYVCQENVDFPTAYPTGLTQNITFTSNNNGYTRMSAGVGLDWQLEYNNTIVYGTTDPTDLTKVWVNDNYKTVKLETDQEVSEEFATWFNSNFVKQPDTVTIEAGTYVCDKPNKGTFINGTFSINFTSNSQTFTTMQLAGDGTIGIDLYYGNVSAYTYYNDGSGFEEMYADTWTNTAYKTITISTPQSVSPEFGEWFNSNFEKQDQSGGAY